MLRHLQAWNYDYDHEDDCRYEPFLNTPEFYNEKEALDYWGYNEKRISESNIYNDTIVIIRREVNNVLAKELWTATL